MTAKKNYREAKYCELPGCDEIIPMWSARGRLRRGCCAAHTDRIWRMTRSKDIHLRELERGRNRCKRRRVANLGRSCQWCLCIDDEVPFTSMNTCEACSRRISPSRTGPCAYCGRPMLVVGSVSGSVARNTHLQCMCAVCNEDSLLLRDYIAVVLLSPVGTPDRERTVWLSRQHLLGTGGCHKSAAHSAWRARKLLRLTKAILRTDETMFYRDTTPEIWRLYRR